MKKDETLARELCRKFCAYYKPGSNEDIACRGYVLIEQLTRAGRLASLEFHVNAVTNSADDMLVRRICTSCPFRKNDCDFMMDRRLPPCGGFVLLSKLIGSGRIMIDEIK